MASETKRITLFLNGKSVEGTIGNLRKKSRELNNEINQLTPGTTKYLNKIKQLKGVNKDLDVHKSKINGVNKGFSGIGGLVSKIGPVGLAIGVATTAVVSFGKKAVDAFRIQAKAIAKVEQAIKSTGGAARLTSRQLQDEASMLQENSLFGDEDILNGVTAQLLTFTNIAGDEFKRTQQVALDLSTVLDTDLKSSSLQLGKALNDPVKGLSALGRSGIQFSKEQQEVIKGLAETNQVAEAQNVILNELERQYGGQAKAAAEADGGLQQMSNTVGDLFEQIGELLLPVIKSVVSRFSEMVKWVQTVVKAFKEWDVAQLQVSLLKWFDTLTYGVTGIGELTLKLEQNLEQQRRVKASVDEATNSINEQATGFNTLIEVVKSSNTTDEEKSKAITQLNDKYGDLIGEVDLTGASLEQLNLIQDETNKKIIETTIARQKQIEFEKAFQAQVQASQKVLLGDGFQDVAKLALSDEDFEALQSKQIEDRLNGITKAYEAKTDALSKTEEKLLDLEAKGNGLKSFGASITVSDDLINESTSKLKSLTSELSRIVGSEYAAQIAAGGAESKKAFQRALDVSGDDKQITKLKAAIDANLNVINESRKIQTDAVREVAGIGSIANDEAEKATGTVKKKADTLAKELEKLKESIAKFQQEAANTSALAAVTDAEDNEILKLEQALEKKFEKEIASAEKLAQAKGSIGIDAQEQLDAVLLIKQQEFETSKLDIVKKFEAEKAKAIILADAENKDLTVQAERTHLSTLLLEATFNASQVSSAEANIRKAALEEVNEAKKNLMIFEKKVAIADAEEIRDARLLKLDEQLAAGLITEEEYNSLRKDQDTLFLDQKKNAELKFREEIEAVDIKLAESEKERRQKMINDITNASNLLFTNYKKLSEMQINNEIASSDSITTKRMADLEKEKKQGLITEEDYSAEKTRIEEAAVSRVNNIKRQAAKDQRNADILQATVNGALAFVEALPNYPLALASIASTAIQIGTIRSQPLPQFKKGGARVPVVGADDGRTYNAEYMGRHAGGFLPNHPSLVLASEVGTEYFVPNHLLANPVVANHVGVIEAIRSGRQMANGGYTGSTNEMQASAIQSTQNTELALMGLTSVMARMNAQLAKGINAKIGDSEVDRLTDKQNEIAEIKG